jgi:O-antigen/teichoic acid export membrane protein
MAERRSARLLHESLGVFGAQLAITAIGVGTGVIVARTLGPEGRGHFQLLSVFPAFLSNFVKLGIPQATVYSIRRRGAATSTVVSHAFVFALVLGGALTVGSFLCRDWLLATALKGAPPETLPPILLLFPFVLVQAFFLGALQAEERFREYSFQQVAPTLLGFFGMAIALLWLHLGLFGAVLVQTIVVMFVTVWLAVRVHRRAPLRLVWDPPLAREMLTFGGKSYVQTLAATLHRSLDQYMLNFFVGAAPVGLYAVGVGLTNILLKIPDAIGTVLFPRLAGLPEREAHAETSRACRLTLFVTTSLAILFFLFGGFAIRTLYGARFGGAVRPMYFMLPGVVLMSLYLILTRNFTSRNRQGVNILAAATALGANVVLNWLLIPRWGAEGAALSHGISYGLAAILLLVMFVRESGHTLAETVLVGRDELEALVRGAFASRGPAAKPAK